MNISQLGDLVKQKYAGYANRASEEIGNAVVRKFPQYGNMISPIPQDQVLDEVSILQNKAEDLADYKDALESELAHPGAKKKLQLSGRGIPSEYRKIKKDEVIVVGAPSPTSSPTVATEAMPVRPRVLGKVSDGQKPATVDYLETTILPITRSHGIPDAIAAGMWAAEGRGSHKYGKAPYNNPFNINAVDSNPNLAHRYKTEQEGVEAFVKLIKKRYAEALRETLPDRQLSLIEKKGYAGDPKTYKKRSDSGFSSYSKFIQSTPEYRYYAR